MIQTFPLRTSYPLAIRDKIERLWRMCAFRSPFGSVFQPMFGGGGEAVVETYITKVLSYSPIAYWPLNEAAGATAAVCQVNALQNGTPANVTFHDALGPDGVNYAPSFNGTTSSINIQTATLAAKFPAAGTEGTLSFWFKALNVGIWTDTKFRLCLYLRANENNQIQIRKSSTNNQYDLTYTANAAFVSYSLNPFSSTTWTHVGMRWSDSDNLVEYFLNGVEIAGSQDIMNATWAGALTVSSIGSGIATFWSGWLAHVALFNIAASDAVMLELGTPTG